MMCIYAMRLAEVTKS